MHIIKWMNCINYLLNKTVNHPCEQKETPVLQRMPPKLLNDKLHSL